MNISKWLKMGFTMAVVSLCVSIAFAGDQIRKKDPRTGPARAISWKRKPRLIWPPIRSGKGTARKMDLV